MRPRWLCLLLASLCLPLMAQAQAVEPAPKPPPDVQTRSPGEQEADRAKTDQEVRGAADALKQAAGGNGAGIAVGAGPELYWAQSKPAQAMQKAAWIGLSVSPAPPALRHQLRLPEGTGLVVDFVHPKSPGEEGGIKQYDLLEKLDDQILVNPDQFAVLVRTYKAGDQVKLTLLREGKREIITVKLVQREVTPLPEQVFGFFRPVPDGAIGGMTTSKVGPMPAPPSRVPNGVLAGDEKTFTWVDGDQLLIITSQGGHNVLSARDARTGKQLYTGPLDTKEQRAKLSSEVREALDKANFWEWAKPTQPDGQKPAPAPRE